MNKEDICRQLLAAEPNRFFILPNPFRDGVYLVDPFTDYDKLQKETVRKKKA